MAKRGGGGEGELSRFLQSHLRTTNDTFQMMMEAAPPSLEKVEWSEVAKLGDQVSKQATVAGMLWSGELPDVETLKENIVAYFNVLQGFLLVCHGSTVGAGPTLHKCIQNSAKKVVHSSISLFDQAVSAYESHSPARKTIIPQLTGAVWEACVALKKVPATNCTAIGRAITQLGVYLKDVLREMKELPIADFDASAAKESSNGDAHTASSSGKEEFSMDLELDDDFSPEEIAIARLVIAVASDSLILVRELIRFITGLLKSSGDESGANEDKVEAMEKLLTCCREMADQVNDLAASVYPPQEISQMQSTVKKLYSGVHGMRNEIGNLRGSPESAFVALEGFEESLRALESQMDDDSD